MKYLSGKPSFSELGNSYIEELQDEIDVIDTLAKKYRKARTEDRLDELDVLSRQNARHSPLRHRGTRHVVRERNSEQRVNAQLELLKHNKGIAEDLQGKLRSAETPAELKTAIQNMDNLGYARGIASVALHQFDWWVKEMGYHPDRQPG